MKERRANKIMQSSKFDFLSNCKFPKLENYCKKAEKCLEIDSNISLLYLGKVGETIIKLLHKHYNISSSISLQELTQRGIINEIICEKLNALLEFANDYDSQITAKRLIDTACEVSKWFIDSFGESKFNFLKEIPALSKLAEYGREAEENLYSNVRYCLLCIGDMGEFIAEFMSKNGNIATGKWKQSAKIQALLSRNLIDKDKSNLLDKIRDSRNKAVHLNKIYSQDEGQKLLDYALTLCESLYIDVISPDDIISGKITEIDEEYLSVSIGNIPGLVTRNEIPLENDENLSDIYHEGEIKKFRVVDVSDTKIILSLININTQEQGAKSSANNSTGWHDKKFLTLCKTAQHSLIKSALKQGANPNASKKNKFTALMMAAQFNRDPEAINVLIDSGANINAANNHGQTALFFAAQYNFPLIIKTLCDRGADITIIDKFGKSAFSYAKARKKNKLDNNILILLQQKQTTPPVNDKIVSDEIFESDNNNNDNNEKRPSNLEFLELCKTGTAQEINDAIKAGADVNSKDENHNTALMIAAESNNDPEAINVLIDSGANIDSVNAQVRTALILAVMNKKLETIKILCSRNADTKILDIYHKSALSYALGEIKDSELLKLLAGNRIPDTEFLELCKNGTSQEIHNAINDGANVYARDPNNNTLLMIAAEFNTPEVIRALIKDGAMISHHNMENSNALMKAAEFNNLEAVKMLIQNNINEANKLGDTALILAAANNSPEVLIYLIKAGANIDAQNDNLCKAVDMAIDNPRMKDSEILKYLLNRELMKASNQNIESLKKYIAAGANINAQDQNGNTPLMFAAMRRQKELFNFLRDSGADMNIKNNAGFDAHDFARKFLGE